MDFLFINTFKGRISNSRGIQIKSRRDDIFIEYNDHCIKTLKG